MSKCWGMVLVAVVALGLAPVSAGAAEPRPVVITACGQVITTDAVLHTDLQCAGDGIVVTGSNLTVRLEGHTIRSTDGTGFGIRFGSTLDWVCGDDAIVRGGTITGFAGGVAVDCQRGSGDGITSMTLTGNTWGVYSWGDTTFSIDHTTMIGPNGVGPRICCYGIQSAIDLSHSTVKVTSSTGFAWFVALAPPSSITRSRIEGGQITPAVDDYLDIADSHLTGVTLQCGDADMTVEDSLLTASPVAGTTDCQQTFRRDRFVGPGTGVGMYLESPFLSSPSSVTDSTFSGWTTALLVYGPGVEVTDNTFQGNGTGLGERPGAGCITTPLCQSTVTGNRFVDNTGPGLSVTTGLWAIGGNTALGNGGLGIDAEGTSILDQGGNVARHNAAPQCVGVVCTPHA